MNTRVLQVAYRSLDNAGIQKVIMNIVENTNIHINHDILLFSDKKGFYDDEFLKHGKIHRILLDSKNRGKFYNLMLKIFRPFISFYKTYKLLSENKYDAIHCHNASEAGITLLVAKMKNIPIRINHSHNTKSPQKSIIRDINAKLMRGLINKYANVKVGCSEEANSYMYGDSFHESIVIPNAIDLDKFNPESYTRNQTSQITISHIGRFSLQKNQLYLIDIFNEIQRKIDNVHLNLVGFGRMRNEVENKIISLGLQDKVSLLHHDTNIPKLLAQSDYFIFPSTYEGLGIALIEAQVMEVKCIASDVVPKSADIGLCDFLSLKNTPKTWAEYIINDIEKAEKGKVNEILKEQYNIRKVSLTYDRMYRGEYPEIQL